MRLLSVAQKGLGLVLDLNLDDYFERNPITFDKDLFKQWQDGLTDEDKRVLQENAEEIKRQKEAGTYEERDADYYLRNPVVVSDRVEPIKGTPTYARENPTETSSTAQTTTPKTTTSLVDKVTSVFTGKDTNTNVSVSNPTAEPKKTTWFPGIQNWQVITIGSLIFVATATGIYFITSGDDKKGKKNKKKK